MVYDHYWPNTVPNQLLDLHEHLRQTWRRNVIQHVTRPVSASKSADLLHTKMSNKGEIHSHFASACLLCDCYLFSGSGKTQLKPISTERRPAICFGPLAAAKIRSTLLQPESDFASVPEGKIQFPARSDKKRQRAEKQEIQTLFFSS